MRSKCETKAKNSNTNFVNCTTSIINHLPVSPHALCAAISRKTSPYSNTVRNLFHLSTGTDYKWKLHNLDKTVQDIILKDIQSNLM